MAKRKRITIFQDPSMVEKKGRVIFQTPYPSKDKKKRITIFRTQDPYASEDKWDLQFIAFGKLTLKNYGELDSEALCKLGLGEPGENFWIISDWFFLLLDRPIPIYIPKLIMRDAELGRVLIVCGYQDNISAYKRYKERLRAKERVELIARLQRVPLIRAWNSVTSKISRAVSHHSDLKPQSRLSQITYLLTCWRQRRVNDYGYLEALDIMKAEKEYWEAFHKSRQDARA